MLAHDAETGWQPAAAVSAASAALFAFYKPLLDAGHALAASPAARPWVLAQLGQSLDGCIATASGDSHYVSGARSLLHLHRLRALCDAVLVGAATVAGDDPQLTTRLVPGPDPVRVVLDPDGRLDGRSRIFRDGRAPTLWLCDRRHADAARARLPAQDGIATVLAVDGLAGAGDTACGGQAAAAVAALGARGLRLLVVEGGGRTVSRFLAEGMLDRLHLGIAPVLIGRGRRGLDGPARLSMAECPRPPARVLALGDDIWWDLDLRGGADDRQAAGTPGGKARISR